MEQQKELIAAARANTVKAPSFYGGGSRGAAELQVGVFFEDLQELVLPLTYAGA